ncbi:hypothetical protein KJ688_13160 [bacterium]|nr:hypothetical protein [bacterium]
MSGLDASSNINRIYSVSTPTKVRTTGRSHPIPSGGCRADRPESQVPAEKELIQKKPGYSKLKNLA